MANYQALTDFLRRQPDPVIEVTFTQLDSIVGGLPRRPANTRHDGRTVEHHSRTLTSGLTQEDGPNRTSTEGE